MASRLAFLLLCAVPLAALADADYTVGLYENMSPLRRTTSTEFFRLGSGALRFARPIDTPIADTVVGRKLAEDNPLVVGRKLAEHNKMVQSTSFAYIFAKMLTVAAIALLCLMVPGGGRDNPQGQLPGMITGGRDFNYRIPPPWSPEYESSYSFRAYMTDLSLWIMLTDLQPHQQCAAIIMRLGGAAREMARMISPQEMIFGGIRNGQQLDPVTYLLGALHARFAALEEESRLACMTEMLAFQRKPHENINALLARYESVKQRAAIEGQFVMSVEGCSLQLLRACGIQPSQLFIMLQPFGGQLPQTDEHFNQLCTQLRRFGHMAEGVRGNAATVLNSGMHQARPGTYLIDGSQQAKINQGLMQAAQSANSGPMESFFQHASPSFMTDLGGDAPWDQLQPESADPFATWSQAAWSIVEPSGLGAGSPESLCAASAVMFAAL